jgi:hypothetical protein
MQAQMASRRKKLIPKAPVDVELEMAVKAGLTPERFRKAEGAYDVGDDQQGGRIVTLRDSPLERSFNRGVINQKQYSAGQKYRHHWYHAGLAEPLQTLDLNRVFGGDGFTGMAKTEQQMFHRQRYREASKAAGKVGSHVLDWVVCRETSLVHIGFSLGWTSSARAYAAGTERLKAALDELCDLWGIG